MNQLTYKIDQSVFDDFPSFSRAILICNNLINDIPSTIRFSDIKEVLSVSLDELSTSVPVISWRKAFRKMDIDPTKDRVSFESLTRRILSTGTLKSINNLVDLGNRFSVLHQCPIGIHPISGLVGDIELRKAKGTEIFLPIQGEETEHPNIDEIILVNGINVLTRRFCWRQSKQSIIGTDVTSCFINFDFINPETKDNIEKLISEFRSSILSDSPNTQFNYCVLNINNRNFSFVI